MYVSILFVLLRVALVNTESLHGSGCLWSSWELGANIHSVSGRRRSRREVPFPGFGMVLPMQIEFKCVTCSNPLPSIVSIESVLLLCPTAPYLLLYPWIHEVWGKYFLILQFIKKTSDVCCIFLHTFLVITDKIVILNNP